ncbi:BTAD domain-containing putative transcriptional regulator [Terrabacter sp. LjRoot27]|uniref:AfsR/SARP family transcriptional regulator n=1 Tax=Terrabacter sp. LjRoot27 TaxID=3342306 RepID=UPI003ED041E5
MSAVLECLIARAPHVVTVPGIIDEVWGESPTSSAPTQVYGYVRGLRTRLGDTHGALIRTCGDGYRLVTGPGDVDAALFGARVDEGLAAFRAGSHDEAAAALDSALALWRGEPLPGATGEQARMLADRLTGRWMTATECRLQIEIDAGRHEAVVEHVQDLVARHPLREHLRRQLLVSLYRSGRLAEALHEYDRLRRTLAEELGTDPSAETQAVHQQILAGTLPPGTAAHRVGPRATARAESPIDDDQKELPIRQLPPGIPDFTGRAREVEEMLDLFSATDVDAPTVVVVHGAPGTGKSTLALHVARRVRDRFPDAQFHLDLAGTATQPRDPAELLAAMLHALGQLGRPLPDTVEARAALMRSHLGERRTLVVLDDAASAQQVQALLPPHGHSAVIVTSRHLLTDLPGAHHVHLGLLDPRDAEEMMCRIVGGARTALEPHESRTIVELCGYLPLSIRIASGKLLGRPTWPLKAMRQRLADESRRLAELSLGDLDVRASVDLSLRSLPDDVVRGHDLLGLLGSCDQPGWVLSALLGQPAQDDVMERLVDANLVQLVSYDSVGQPRYRMHDLLRSYARQRATARGEDVCRAAVRRLLSGWTALVDEARSARPPSLFDPFLEPLAGAGDAWRLPVSEARGLVEDTPAWLLAERRALLDALGLARDWGLGEESHDLATSLSPLYDEQALYDDWTASHEVALACEGHSPLARASLWRGLAQSLIYSDELTRARQHLQRALDLFRQEGHDLGAALTLAGLATVHRHQGRLDLAEGCLRAALPTVLESGDAPKEALLRGSLGRILVAQNRLEEARPWFAAALRLARAIGDVHREGVVLRDLGELHHRLGQTGEALRDLEHALATFTELRDERCIAYTLLQLGRIHVDLLDRDRATTTLVRAARIFRRNHVATSEQLCQALLHQAADLTTVPVA